MFLGKKKQNPHIYQILTSNLCLKLLSYQCNAINGISWIEIFFWWRPGKGSWNYLKVAFSGLKFIQLGWRYVSYYSHFVPCHIVRNILDVDVQQIEFAIDLDVNPVTYWERHEAYFDCAETIPGSLVFNMWI